MKFIIADGGTWEFLCAPTDDDGPDHVLSFIIRGDAEHDYSAVSVQASRVYAFMDWLRQWCPDPRKAEGEGA